ncbi:mechanosensitive ion channel family protein [Robbsia sp. KACC 23696]|uniref:mechanosensitive ion channel family protein n=1 Tax=Robbsia sp. KACC 23696 TaxID=3149231 RepID=UPI00325B6694
MLTLALPDWLTAALFGGLTAAQWIGAAVIAALGYPALDGLRRWAIRRLSALAATLETASAAADTASSPAMRPTETYTLVAIGLLRHTRKPMMIAVSVLAGLSLAATIGAIATFDPATLLSRGAPHSAGTAMTATGNTDTLLAWLKRGWQTVFLLQSALWASQAVSLLSDRYLDRHRLRRARAAAQGAASPRPASDASGAAPMAAPAMSPVLVDAEDGINPVIVRVLAWFARALMWALFLLSLLAQGGVNVTAFVASLSIGAAAIGFAVQGILSDLFASLAIGLDKPFRIGDYVSFGEVSGTIEQVGMKTTRIRSLRGEEIICSNTALLQQQIHNFQRMETRRIAFRFGLAYATSAARLRAVPAMVEQALARIPNTRLDRVHFASFADRALEFEVVYYVNRPEYAVYMDCQQALNLAIVDGLAALGIAFAQPIREIRMLDGAPAGASTADALSPPRAATAPSSLPSAAMT